MRMEVGVPAPRWNRRKAVDELIELLRALARHEHSDVSIAEEAAAALEAAREDAERYRWLRDAAPEAWAEIGAIMSLPEIDAAIDQARGKGVRREAE